MAQLLAHAAATGTMQSYAGKCWQPVTPSKPLAVAHVAQHSHTPIVDRTVKRELEVLHLIAQASNQEIATKLVCAGYG
jgi:Mrp family chromosome partitioning ATPase